MIGVAGFTDLTWRDAVSQTRPGEAALWRDAQRLVQQISRRIGDGPAVAWVHTAAVLSHAAHYGLIHDVDLNSPDGVRRAVEGFASSHPALACWADPAVNALWRADISPEETRSIADLYREHPVDDLPGVPDGYRIGDLYQQLSEEARKGRALCQTPQWVSDLLLRLSLDQAVDEAGWDGIASLKMIDPSCGTGHILVESALRFEGWRWSHPRRARRETQGEVFAAALSQVHGVDLDPYAVAVARYRLLAMAAACSGASLAGSPRDLPVQVSAADSLLANDEPLLERGRYDVVVANPPYIVVKDKAAMEAIRARYPEVCNGQYSLALPFHQLMHELLIEGGWCAQLTANSFMKREFGQRYIEEWLARQDLRWVIDTSGAYIPGHGTPTVILVTRNQPPTGTHVSSVLSSNGEPATPAHPARGRVWGEIRRWVAERDVAARVDAALASSAETVDDSATSEPVPSPGVREEREAAPAGPTGVRAGTPRRPSVSRQPEQFGLFEVTS